MNGGRQRVLHIGGSITDARRIQEALTGSNGESYTIEWVGKLSEGLESLTTKRASAVLLDLELTDCLGVDALRALFQIAPDIPILVIGGEENEETARRVVLAGAAEYLLTNRLDSYWLPRALQHAVERKLSETASFAEIQRTELALNSFGDGFISTDLAGCVTSLNETAEG